MTEIVTIGPRRSAPPRNRPEGFSPAYDAFEPRFASHDCIVLVMFGFEARARTTIPGALKARLEACLATEPRPAIREAGVTLGAASLHAEMHFVYWKHVPDYQAWVETSGIETLFDDETLRNGDVGLWREICFLSLDHNETSSSRHDELTGLANMADQMAVTVHHGYWGSARDRIVTAAEDELGSDACVDPGDIDGKGRRLTVRAPENACFIRSSQDLSRANLRQREMYLGSVRPALLNGLAYLQGNPVESGCVDVRFVEELGNDGNSSDRSCVVACFRSLADLENWTHHHPTHQAIMASFLGMVQHWHGQPGLHLWHEITVFPQGTLYGDYVNCASKGGMLAFGEIITPAAIKAP